MADSFFIEVIRRTANGAEKRVQVPYPYAGDTFEGVPTSLIVTDFADPDDETVPSSKAVDDAIDLKADSDISGLSAAAPVTADIFSFRTAGGLLKKVTLGDLATAIDGELNP